MKTAGDAMILAFAYILYTDLCNGCDVATEYECSNKNCIPRKKVNDTFNDCGDNSDEVPNPCGAPLFSCLNDRCILIEWVLDGQDDCLDGTDEVRTIGMHCNGSQSCEDSVRNSVCLNGTCQCRHGYFIGHSTLCQQRLIGSKCQYDADCRDIIPGSWCGSEGRCVCQAHLTETAGGAQCVDLGPLTSIVVIAGCIVIIALLAIFYIFLVIWLLTAFVFRPPGSPQVTTFRQMLAILEQGRPSRPKTSTREPVKV